MRKAGLSPGLPVSPYLPEELSANRGAVPISGKETQDQSAYKGERGTEHQRVDRSCKSHWRDLLCGLIRI
jgi:hypothetical protein